LPCRAGELEVNGAVWQALLAPAFGDFVAEDRADRAIGVDDRQLGANRLALFERRLC
jgi:hypothetical protein